jgi:hypothetical protein
VGTAVGSPVGLVVGRRDGSTVGHCRVRPAQIKIIKTHYQNKSAHSERRRLGPSCVSRLRPLCSMERTIEGATVGSCDGILVGICDGMMVGRPLGPVVGSLDGRCEGITVGRPLGDVVGSCGGRGEGESVGVSPLSVVEEEAIPESGWLTGQRGRSCECPSRPLKAR